MPAKLTTTLAKIPSLQNEENAAILTEFHRYLRSKGASENHQNNCIKAALAFGLFLRPSTTFAEVDKRARARLSGHQDKE